MDWRARSARSGLRMWRSSVLKGLVGLAGPTQGGLRDLGWPGIQLLSGLSAPNPSPASRPLGEQDASLPDELDVAEAVVAALEQDARRARCWALEKLPVEDRLVLHLGSARSLSYEAIAGCWRSRQHRGDAAYRGAASACTADRRRAARETHGLQ